MKVENIPIYLVNVENQPTIHEKKVKDYTIEYDDYGDIKAIDFEYFEPDENGEYVVRVEYGKEL